MPLTHPYQDLTGGQWLCGNLHAHTTRSDGEREPQAVVDDYAGRGHGFLMISDHDIFTSPDDHATLDAGDLLLIPGNEVTRNGPHMLHVGADRLVEPHGPRQLVIDAINQSQGFCVAAHPNWQEAFDHCPLASLREWQGYLGIEVYNGVISRLQGSPYATNKWDMLLASGRRLWGFAHDDSHAAQGDTGLGWNTVYVTDNSAAGVVDALQHGRFYPSTGVMINSIQVDGTRIRITTDNARRIIALSDLGRRFHTADNATIECDVPDDATYVRFECWGDGETFAWTQPFFVDR
ncbi:MAG: phosphoesterase [Phycisphaerae bacterium]|nr:phosphoesterase [Phycisphaerae bacterium]